MHKIPPSAATTGLDVDVYAVFLLRILWVIKIITDSNTVNVVRSTLALLQCRECRIAQCYTALKALAVGR